MTKEWEGRESAELARLDERVNHLAEGMDGLKSDLRAFKLYQREQNEHVTAQLSDVGIKLATLLTRTEIPAGRPAASALALNNSITPVGLVLSWPTLRRLLKWLALVLGLLSIGDLSRPSNLLDKLFSSSSSPPAAEAIKAP